MIDLHMHTTYSDGADTLIDLLKKAEQNRLEYISITDHDNCKAYKELKNIEVKDYFGGNIITGIEIKCAYNKRLIEVLGYKIDTDKMQDWADEFYKNKSKKVLQQKYFDILYDKCLELNIKLDSKENIEFNSSKDWASVTIYNEIKKNSKNKALVPEDLWADFNSFSKKYCGDPKYKLYIDKTVDYPTLEEAIQAIRQAGGLVFLPHLFIYKWAENIYEVIDDILNNYDIDGIECYHSEFSEENIEYLLNLCNERNYLKSGGSDYHGSNKKNVEMAVGKGNLKIDKNIIENWV